MRKYGAFFLLTLLPAPLAAQESIVAHWSTNATFARGQNGRSVTLVCPPGEPSNAWGSKVYTDDSSVCTAALHAGAIDRRGGAITVTIQPGRSKYEGSSSNGVETHDYGAHDGSFSVSKATGEGQVEWTTTAKGLATSSIKELTVICPPGGSAAPVWGTETYTDDSSICAAAVHAGVITFANGGKVTLQPGGARRSYTGSVRRGVTSGEFGAYESSFELAGAKPEPTKVMADPRVVKSPPPSASNTPAPKAINPQIVVTPKVAIVGTATPQIVRSIKTSAVKIFGLHSSPPPRLITTPAIVIIGTSN